MGMRRYALIGVALAAGAQQKSVNFYSVEKEAALGARLASEMAAKTTPLNNPAASAYVDRVERELAAQIPDSPFRCMVTVVKDDLHSEPAVLPGGFIYLPTGMFAAAQSESEFAGLLARAMADVAQRAATRRDAPALALGHRSDRGAAAGNHGRLAGRCGFGRVWAPPFRRLCSCSGGNSSWIPTPWRSG
jgi:predicted Zn-dependent protease